MSFFDWLKTFFARLFGNNTNERIEEPETSEHALEDTSLEIPASEEAILKKFEFKNVIITKLDFLEEYIKSFAQSHSAEYATYFDKIKEQRTSYEAELQEYLKGLEGDLTFSIDPERESMRQAQVTMLESDIYAFFNHVVLYDKYKEAFSVLCCKSNTLYNSIINWRISAEKLKEHFTAANMACEKLISEVQQLDFFKNDSRKKEKILHHIIYFDYLLFKSALRYGFCNSLHNYKCNVSKLHKFFVDTEYDDSVLKFFMQDLECIRAFLTSNLQSYEIYPQLIEACEQLQIKAQASLSSVIETSHFEGIIKLENTSEEAGKTCGVDFVLKMPEFFGTTVSKTASVNTIVISVLKLIESNEAKLLLKLVKGFKIDISWKEFYFLCKIFELHDEVVQISKNTIFTSVQSKFLEFDQKYPQYSAEYIAKQKRSLLLYRGSKKKKYILLFDIGQIDFDFAANQLQKLQLDFLLRSDGIYLNHSYFNGFKNLEQIFGNYISI